MSMDHASTAAYLATQVLSLSVYGTVNELYGLYAADAWLWYGQPVRTVFAPKKASAARLKI